MSWAALPCLPNGDRLKLSVPTTKMTLSAFGCGDRDGKLANSENGLEKHQEAGKLDGWEEAAAPGCGPHLTQTWALALLSLISPRPESYCP